MGVHSRTQDHSCLTRGEQSVFEAIRDHLSKHATQYFPDLVGTGTVHLEGRTRPERRRFSFVYRFDISAGGEILHRVAAKVPCQRNAVSVVDGMGDQRLVSRASKEYEALVTLQRISRDVSPAWRPVRVLDYVGKANAILTEWASGPTLAHLLTSWQLILNLRPNYRTILERLVYDCGRGLKEWHLRTAAQSDPTCNGTGLLTDCEEYLHQLGEHGVPEGTLERIRTRLLQRSPEVPGASEAGRLIGDFQPRNIIVRREGVTVLDPSSGMVGPCLEDVGKFLISMRTLGLNSWRFRAHRPTRLRWFELAFLRGYFGDGPISPLTDLYLVKHLIRRWYEVLVALEEKGLPRPVRNAVRDSYLGRYFTAEVYGQLNEVERASSALADGT